MREEIEVGFQAFLDGGTEEFGAIREISPDGNGDFFVPTGAVISVQSEKVTFDFHRLDAKLRAAITRAHEQEDS